MMHLMRFVRILSFSKMHSKLARDEYESFYVADNLRDVVDIILEDIGNH